MRNLSCAVNVRRRGRSKSPGDAAAGSETIVGRRPSSLSAPAAARVLLSLIRRITTGCLSYALKGKLPAGLCLIFLGTEGNGREPTRNRGKSHAGDALLYYLAGFAGQRDRTDDPRSLGDRERL